MSSLPEIVGITTERFTCAPPRGDRCRAVALENLAVEDLAKEDVQRRVVEAPQMHELVRVRCSWRAAHRSGRARSGCRPRADAQHLLHRRVQVEDVLEDVRARPRVEAVRSGRFICSTGVATSQSPLLRYPPGSPGRLSTPMHSRSESGGADPPSRSQHPGQ